MQPGGVEKYYKALRLKPGASEQQIKKAYRRMAKVWHPDRFVRKPLQLNKAQAKMKELNEAYDFLQKNPGGRPAADQSAYYYQPRGARYSQSSAVSTIRFKERKRKKPFDWGRVRTILFIAGALFFLFSDTAAPWRHQLAELIRKIPGHAKPSKRATPRPAPAPQPPSQPQPQQPQPPPELSQGPAVQAPPPKDEPDRSFRRFKRRPAVKTHRGPFR